MERVLPAIFKEMTIPPFQYRRLNELDTKKLFDLISSQEITDLEYFNPHGWDLLSIRKQFDNRSFLMMGAFDGEGLVGYFFLRLFANKKCFVGRLIDKKYRGKGMGSVMNRIMYETAWRIGFRCLSTISLHNTYVMRAHAKNPNIIVLKELHNDYLLVEFVRDAKRSKNSITTYYK